MRFYAVDLHKCLIMRKISHKNNGKIVLKILFHAFPFQSFVPHSINYSPSTALWVSTILLLYTGAFFSFSLCFLICIYLQGTALPLFLLPFSGILNTLLVSLVSLVHLLSLLLTDKSFRLSHSYYKTKSGVYSFIFSILKNLCFFFFLRI